MGAFKHICSLLLRPLKRPTAFITKGMASLLILGICLQSCITDFEGQVGGSAEVLVVGAILTNELKKQELALSRSYSFENAGPRYETDAQVQVVSSDGQTFSFYETPNGRYKSVNAFAAQEGRTYQLEITTVTGDAYVSSPMGLPPPTSLENLVATASSNEQGQAGISITANGSGPATATKFRYDFEENWKIVAPYWSPYDLLVRSEGRTQINLAVVDRETEEQTCYGSARPQEVLLNSTASLSSNEVVNFPIRFIAKDNYFLQHRYSIGVKQYGLSDESYAYYQTLQRLSMAADNFFSEDQPGFLQGNVVAVADPTKPVAGYFEVSSVSEKRIFINFQDYYPGEPKPAYVVECVLTAPSADINAPVGGRVLLNAIYNNVVRYYGINNGLVPGGSTFVMVSPKCGDCTTLGSNIKPDFWID